MDIRTIPPRKALDPQDIQPDRLREYEQAAGFLARFLIGAGILAGVALGVWVMG